MHVVSLKMHCQIDFLNMLAADFSSSLSWQAHFTATNCKSVQHAHVSTYALSCNAQIELKKCFIVSRLVKNSTGFIGIVDILLTFCREVGKWIPRSYLSVICICIYIYMNLQPGDK